MTVVMLSRPSLKLTANQWAGEAEETRKACSEQCILGIPFSPQELDGGSGLRTDHMSCLQGEMWTRASVALPNHRVGLSAAGEFPPECSSTDSHHDFPDSVESLCACAQLDSM